MDLETMDELLKMTRGDSDMTYENPYMNGSNWPELNILEISTPRNPLVICITNDVVRTFTANGLLAIGASPVMSECSEDLKTLSFMHRRYSLILVLLPQIKLVTTKRP